TYGECWLSRSPVDAIASALGDEPYVFPNCFAAGQRQTGHRCHYPPNRGDPQPAASRAIRWQPLRFLWQPLRFLPRPIPAIQAIRSVRRRQWALSERGSRRYGAVQAQRGSVADGGGARYTAPQHLRQRWPVDAAVSSFDRTNRL